MSGLGLKKETEKCVHVMLQHLVNLQPVNFEYQNGAFSVPQLGNPYHDRQYSQNSTILKRAKTGLT